jgi:hypothetical protein
VCNTSRKNRLHPVHGFFGFYTVDNNNTEECYNKLPNIDNTHNPCSSCFIDPFYMWQPSWFLVTHNERFPVL